MTLDPRTYGFLLALALASVACDAPSHRFDHDAGRMPASSATLSPVTPGVGGAAVTCGGGTYCTPSDDLAAPAAGDGFQLVAPGVTLEPGRESYLCYYKNPPGTNGAAVDVGRFESWMTAPFSHHLSVFIGGAYGSTEEPDETMQLCSPGAGQWLFGTSKSGVVVGRDMPEGVGLPLPAGTQLILNMHFINTATVQTTPIVKFNAYYTRGVEHEAGSMVSFNTNIDVPPLGAQTVSGTCTPPTGSKFFLLTTQTHGIATAADVDYASAGATTSLVHSTDWEAPDTRFWDAPNFLTTKTDDVFTYSCTYQSTYNFSITVDDPVRNEICMAIGYFFPAGPATCR